MATNEEVMVYFKGVDNVSNTAQNIKKNVTSIGDSASGIKGKVSGIASSFDSVSSAITGVIGGLSLASMATDAWAGATEKQMNQLLLARKYGDQYAETTSNAIKQVVKNTPGDDSFLTSMLSNASLQAKMTTEELENMGKAIADYNILSQASGSSSFETQGEIRNYLMTGETGRMKDTVLSPFLDKLEQADTVTDRVKVLNDALGELGYAGASDMDSATKSMETFKGTMQQALTNVGEIFLPIVQGILDGFLSLDEMLGGNLSTGLVIVGGGLAAITTAAGVLGTVLPAITSGFEIMGGVLGITQAAEEGVEVASAATATATSLLGDATAVTALEEAGLAAEEVGAAAAHAGNIVSLEAEGIAATETGGAFGFLGAMELSAVWPILLIIAAVAALIIAVEQIGEAFGWWTDFSTMLDAIKAGVMRLWSAFINSPQVQGTLEMIKNAFNSLMTALQPVFAWLKSAWDNLFKSEGAGSGGPDVVRMIIDIFGQLGNIAGTVFSLLQQGFQTVAYLVDPLLQILTRLYYTFVELMDGSTSWEEAIVTTFNSITTGVRQFAFRLAQIALQVGSRIFNGIMSYARRIPGMLWTLLSQAGQRILAFGNTAAARARNAGMRILNAIINYIRQLPGRVYTFMMQVPGRIASAAGAAVGAATSLASQVVQAVTQGVVGVANAVYNEFIQIGSKINESVSSAVSAAASFGSDIKDAVLNALGIASPGIIQRKIAIEFQDIPGRIGESNDYVYSAARDYAGNIMKGFNAPQIPLSSLGTVRRNNEYKPSTSYMGNTTIIYVQPGAIPVDARNMTEREAVNVVTAAFESLFPGGA